MDLKELREKIDSVDEQLVKLFSDRMKIVGEIAEYKKENGLPIYDGKRELEKLAAIAEMTDEEYRLYLSDLYSCIFEVSRSYQHSLTDRDDSPIVQSSQEEDGDDVPSSDGSAEADSEGGFSFGLLGERLAHSYSPMIHGMLGNGGYSLFERDAAGAEDFIRNGDWRGLNVTIPYKQLAYRLSAVKSSTAKKCGSVNTLVKRDGKIYGYNTDYFGFITTVFSLGVDVRGAKCLVLGNGGAAGAVRAALLDLGASKIVTVVRKGENNYENLSRHADADIIVNATPVGMYPDNSSCPIALEPFTKCRAVIDLVFNPLRTRLILEAQRLSIPCAGGLLMLVAQAKKSNDLFFNTTKDDSIIRDIHAKLEKQLGNIVLVGMPGCGKTTVGKIVAERLGRRLIDTDEKVEKAAGMTIHNIFEEYGEAHFRSLEEKAVASAAAQNSAVISVGGGAVLSKENRIALRQNGVVIRLTRDVRSLDREKRPLSAGDLNKMLQKREPYYKEAADYTVANDDEPEEAAREGISKIGGTDE